MLCLRRRHDEAASVSDANEYDHRRPSPRAQPLSAHQVVHTVEYNASDQRDAGAHCGQGCQGYPQAWWSDGRHPGGEGEGERHQQDMAWIGEAEEPRREGRLVRALCELARCTVEREPAATRARRSAWCLVLGAALGVGARSTEAIQHSTAGESKQNVLRSLFRGTGCSSMVFGSKGLTRRRPPPPYGGRAGRSAARSPPACRWRRRGARPARARVGLGAPERTWGDR
eukprot:scaffold130766_cov60-Phaeocystis_antarctica.AAC.1